ncbi:Mss4-like protein [Aspergillus keveii]|uniref:Mss4-like protein n=1 Tax=Aspergillus keveii TaxID=714993 RepID=A0ABR4FNU2_9EURO
MVHGSCYCGAIRIEYPGEPLKTALCHCTDCRKITGSVFTYNFVALRSDLHVSGSGTPKEVSKTADSGNRLVNYHCADCGTPLYGWKILVGADGVSQKDEIVILRAGIFDDEEFLNRHQPDLEVYVKKRLEWVTKFENAEQYECMMTV